jgi:cyclopropane-fatty-acyl-phospholipid synthase
VPDEWYTSWGNPASKLELAGLYVSSERVALPLSPCASGTFCYFPYRRSPCVLDSFAPSCLLVHLGVNMSSKLLERFNALRDYTGTLAWNQLVTGARGACIVLLKKIEVGKLEIVDFTEDIIICGGHAKGPTARIQVLSDTFWVRLALFTDMVRHATHSIDRWWYGVLTDVNKGFADAYLLGEVSCADLVSFFQIFVLNKPYMTGGFTLAASITNSITAMLRATNTLSNAKLHIAAHYDISNAMFAAFLSPDMTYSCPIWLPKSDARCAEESLEEAQDRKLARFIRNGRIKQGDRVLEIGTGWGSMAMKAVKETGCFVTSLTLSTEQKDLADQKIKESGLSDSIQVLLCDYRKLEVPPEGPFDKIISIEMLEAVGREYLVTYFACVDKLLKRNGGIAVFQCITIPDGVSFYLNIHSACFLMPYSGTRTTSKVTTLSGDIFSQEAISLLSRN